MAEVNLDRLSVLVVEDNSWATSSGFFWATSFAALASNLFSFPPAPPTPSTIVCGRIHKVNNNPAAAGISVIDLAVVDVVMPEVDGHMPLRWIRSAESPDRFLPTIMISGAAGFNSVRKARDMGATEFLAKPFSGWPTNSCGRYFPRGNSFWRQNISALIEGSACERTAGTPGA